MVAIFSGTFVVEQAGDWRGSAAWACTVDGRHRCKIIALIGNRVDRVQKRAVVASAVEM